MNLRQTVTDLSHEFGTSDFVRGGGGNTSAKDPDTLMVKPSGTTLAGIHPGDFVALDRAKLADLYRAEPPTDPTAREAMVKDMMLAALREGSAGRPSVEAPLHDSFEATFVVHTHPALVNGMTCSNDGQAVCREVFPKALWVEYTDPGYTLSMVVRDRLEQIRRDGEDEPTVVFLQNHGVFVAGDAPQFIRHDYEDMLSALAGEYERAGIPAELSPTSPAPTPEKTEDLRRTLQDDLGLADAACIAGSGHFPVADGPISPDHIVYARSYPLLGDPTQANLDAYRNRWGYPPRVIACSAGVFGIGQTQKTADLALEFAQDGALVKQLAEAFGGIHYISEKQREFIDNWEVEAYRRKQMQ